MSEAFLKSLEAAAARAAEEIATLRGRGEQLEKRIAELDRALAAAVEAKGGKGGKSAKGGPPAAWEREREELRARVAALVERLEGLVDG